MELLGNQNAKRELERGAHPDVSRLMPEEGKRIPVEAVRAFQQHTGFTPTQYAQNNRSFEI